MMKRIIAVSLLMFATISAQNELSLKQSLELGLSASKDIKISESKSIAAEAKETQASALMLPKLSLGGNYMYMNESPIKIQLPAIPGLPAPADVNDDLTAAIFNVSLEQPIFLGMKLWAMKSSAEYADSAAKAELKSAYNNTAMEIHKAFWNLFKARKVVDLLKETLKSLAEHQKNAEKMMDAGLATRSDFLKIRHKYAEAQLNLIDAENNLKLAKSNFNRALGRKMTDEVSIKPDPNELGLTLGDFDNLYSEALNKRAELESMKYKIKAGEEMTTVSKADYFPQIAVSGSYYYLKLDAPSQPISSDAAAFWNVGLNFKWTLWDWQNTSAKVTEARESVNRAKLAEKNLEEMIYIEVYKNFLTLKKIKEKLGVLDISIQSASENLRLTKNKFKVQTATASDLLDAETDLLKSKIDKLFAIADFQIAKAQLEKSVGRKIY